MEETFLPFPSPFSPLQKRSRPVSFHGLEHFFFVFLLPTFDVSFFVFVHYSLAPGLQSFRCFFLPPLYQVATFHFDEMKILVLVLFLFNVGAILEKTKKKRWPPKGRGVRGNKKKSKGIYYGDIFRENDQTNKKPKALSG